MGQPQRPILPHLGIRTALELGIICEVWVTALLGELGKQEGSDVSQIRHKGKNPLAEKAPGQESLI